MSRRLGLRARTTLTALVLVSVVLGAGGWGLVAILEHQLVASSDQVSRSTARDLLAEAEAGSLPVVVTRVGEEGVAQVFTDDGAVLAASPNIAGRGPITAPAGARAGWRTFDAPDDDETESYRAWVEAGSTDGGRTTVVVGDSLESPREASHRLTVLLLVGLPAALVVLAAVLWLLVGRALGRLDAIRAEVDAIGADQLDRRVDVPGPQDEVGRLATTMNRMLDRVESAARRQRRLVADVSHDLQSPLATQRISLETALQGSGPVDRDVLRGGVLGPLRAMEELVDTLLVLAAADEDVPPRAVPLDLDVLVMEESARARAGAGLRLDTSGISAGPVRADATEIRRAVRNLVDNAVRHATTEVRLAVSVVGQDVVLDVVDDGPGVPPDERDLVFDRFHRGDPARHGAAGGSGLGLAIARSAAERAGGRLDLLRGAGGAHFRMVLPVLRDA